MIFGTFSMEANLPALSRQSAGRIRLGYLFSLVDGCDNSSDQCNTGKRPRSQFSEQSDQVFHVHRARRTSLRILTKMGMRGLMAEGNI